MYGQRQRNMSDRLATARNWAVAGFCTAGMIELALLVNLSDCNILEDKLRKEQEHNRYLKKQVSMLRDSVSMLESNMEEITFYY